MTDYTTNFNLEKYQTGDAANLTDQYNASMDIIDDNLYKINTNANTAGGKATQALETAQNNKKNLTALGVTDTETATQLKNKIDTTATNLAATTKTANNATDNLNALGANTVENATNLKKRINDTYTKNESDNRYARIPVTQDTLIAIGDSYFEGFRTTNPATDSMIVKAAQKLGLKCNNFATGGSGFITGTTFLQQLQKANSTTTDKTKIKYVVIGGGRNDAYNKLKENDVATALTYAKTNFPYSKIVFIPMMYDNTWPTRDDGQKYGVMCAGGRNANVLTVKDAPSWGLYYASGMTDIHPNTEGSEIYAQYIATAIQNNMSAMPRVERHIDATLQGITNGSLSVFINGLDISYVFRGNKTEWNKNIFATVNKSNTWGAWSMLMGFLDNGTPLKLKFDGMNFSIIDVLSGTGAAGIVNFAYDMNLFEHN
nr:MAG: GDSL-like Lipase/Acylhydrolase family protein [Bacteriophage sp.]